ncbi:alpha/beta hydrolase [Clostridium sp. AM58-1XD]|uniref:alpha/beta fold hydrolase n=1 Tax=Clostridium sp. AM58-1XD TaxID=2292307 RepID=UPI000E4FA408|nr:alpha/beta hydrolase [Clostridium sp. AM58-1XD]RGY97715.1 alpha/beta hydrolase [Clostridium sp. AM58-1XD]
MIRSSELHYIGTLRPQEPAVLMIPGALTSPAVFDGIGGGLPCQSAVIDWCGSPGPWDVVEVGKRVLEFISEHELGKTVLAGYSAGGIISMAAGSRDEDKLISGMLISNTGACAVGHGDYGLPQRILAGWPGEDILEPFFARCFARPVPTALKEKLKEYARSLSRETAYEATSSCRVHDLRGELHKITCPVVIAHGKLDQTRREEHVKQMKDGIPDTEVFWLDGGHTIMVEDREHYRKALNYLLDKVGMGK